MKTIEFYLKEGNEGYPLPIIIDNLTENQILDAIFDWRKQFDNDGNLIES